MLSKIKNAASAVPELAAGSATAAFDLAGAGVEQLNKALGEIGGGTGEIREADVSRVELMLSVPPVARLHFHFPAGA